MRQPIARTFACNSFVKRLFIGGAMIGLLAAVTGASAADLNLTVTGIQGNEGRVRVAIYNNSEHFLDETYALTLREKVAREGNVTLQLQGFPAGQYAVFAYHDSNKNRRFDRRLWLIPAEGYGLSNNPPVSESVDFANGEFEISEDNSTDISIELNYCEDKDAENVTAGRVLGCWISQAE